MDKVHFGCLEKKICLQKDKVAYLISRKKGHVKMCDQIVKPLNTQKYLGVVVMEKFTWRANPNRSFSKNCEHSGT